MHVLFVHQNFPAQFGHVAHYLTKEHGFRCTFVSEKPAGESGGIRRIQYRPDGGATAKTHYCARTFENAVAHAMGVYKACRQHSDLKPDLVVGHSGFGSTLYLRELYKCPIINYFEYYYRAHGSDLDFRPEFRPAEIDVLRSYSKNAMGLLDLQNCDAGYCPTRWQKGTLPPAYADKVEVIFDGIDGQIWRRHPNAPRSVHGLSVAPGTRIVTYVSRGFESIRGFDIFMKVAKRIYREHPNVLFVVVGEDRVAYGGDLKYIKEKSFKEHVLKQDDYDLSKFLFTGRLPAPELARLLSISDLHIYLTVPFVLSWSLFNALACGAPVVASDAGPVPELIRHGETGLLAGFYDVEGLARNALRVLRDPRGHRRLGDAGMALIEREYSLTKTLPRMRSFFRRVVDGGRRAEHRGAGPARRTAPRGDISSSFSRTATSHHGPPEVIDASPDPEGTGPGVGVIVTEAAGRRGNSPEALPRDLVGCRIDLSLPLAAGSVTSLTARAIGGTVPRSPRNQPLLLTASAIAGRNAKPRVTPAPEKARASAPDSAARRSAPRQRSQPSATFRLAFPVSRDPSGSGYPTPFVASTRTGEPPESASSRTPAAPGSSSELVHPPESPSFRATTLGLDPGAATRLALDLGEDHAGAGKLLARLGAADHPVGVVAVGVSDLNGSGSDPRLGRVSEVATRVGPAEHEGAIWLYPDWSGWCSRLIAIGKDGRSSGPRIPSKRAGESWTLRVVASGFGKSSHLTGIRRAVSQLHPGHVVLAFDQPPRRARKPMPVGNGRQPELAAAPGRPTPPQSAPFAGVAIKPSDILRAIDHTLDAHPFEAFRTRRRLPQRLAGRAIRLGERTNGLGALDQTKVDTTR